MRKTLLVDGSAVVQRNLAKPHMVRDETKIDGLGCLCKLNPNKVISLSSIGVGGLSAFPKSISAINLKLNLAFDCAGFLAWNHYSS